MKKAIVVGIVCFLIGGVSGYFLRPIIGGTGDMREPGERLGFNRQRPDAMPSGMPDRPSFRPDAMPSGAPRMPEDAV